MPKLAGIFTAMLLITMSTLLKKCLSTFCDGYLQYILSKWTAGVTVTYVMKKPDRASEA